MSDVDVAAFTRKFGYAPTAVPFAQGGIAVFVCRDNPLAGLTMGQLRRVFARDAQPDSGRIDRWGELGLKTQWTDRRIELYELSTSHDDSAAFRQRVMRGAEFSASSRVQLTASSAVQAVAADPDGITFAPIFFRCNAVRALPLAGSDGQFYPCDGPHCRDGRYPLARPYFLYVNRRPDKPLDASMAEFLRFLLSRDGQQVMIDSGVFALPRDALERATSALAL
jgi:phosphate transport system substrate-binding protein